MDRSYDLHYRPDVVTAKNAGTDLMAYDYSFSARNYIDSITDLVNVSEGRGAHSSIRFQRSGPAC